MSSKGRSLSSGTILGITVTLLGGVMLSVAGTSVLSHWLGAGVLAMGLLATLSTMMNRSEPMILELPHRPMTGELRAVNRDDTDSVELSTLLCEFSSRFRSWCERLEANDHLWPSFDRLLRDTLNEFLGARRVRCFRIDEDGRQLVSLTNQEDTPKSLLDKGSGQGVALHGLIEHVVATGHGYRRGDVGNGELVERLAAEWSSTPRLRPEGSSNPATASAPAWLLPLREGTKTTGLIVMGELAEEKLQDVALLQVVADLLELYWHVVSKTDALGIARRTDRASGVLNRIDLTAQAEEVLRQSHAEGEPVVLLSLSVEGVRRLDDEGKWELRDWLMQQVGLEMHHRLRSDDLIGRFSDDRFVAVLRRLDSSLGLLIARKVLEAVAQRINDQPIITAAVKLRCGLSDAETGKDFETALSRSFEALQLARSSQQEVVVGPSLHDRKTGKSEKGNG